MSVQGDGGRLDGDTTLLLIFSCIGETAVVVSVCYCCSFSCHSRFSGFSSGDNTSSLDEGICECRFAVVDVRNDGHVTDLCDVSVEALCNLRLFAIDDSRSVEVPRGLDDIDNSERRRRGSFLY